MTPKRDTERDKAATRKLILDPNRPPYAGGANWLGHGKQGGKDAVIDYLLLDGATIDRLLQERGTEASVRSHFQSLKTLHDLPVTRGADGKYRFDRPHLGLSDDGGTPLPAAALVPGTVRGRGNVYKESGREAVEIWVRRDEADGLPFELDRVVPVQLGVGGRVYRAQFRATAGNAYVWFSPALVTDGGVATTLADVLHGVGLRKNDRVELAVVGTGIEVRRPQEPAPAPVAVPASARGYARLSEHLSRLTASRVTLTFTDVETILGFALPESAHKYHAWWSNSRTADSHTWAHLWLRAGWEKEHVDFAGLRVTFRRADTATPLETDTTGLQPEEGAAPAEEPYTPRDGDRRPIVERQIRERRGQGKFRDDLRERYGDRCLVTGCEVLAVLEAAHIRPYRGADDHHPANGLLLRSDVHTLFDLDLLGVEPDTLVVRVHPSVASEYGHLDGLTLHCIGDCRPSNEALEARYELFCRRP